MLLVFGGILEVTRELNDMWLFDFKNKRWITFFEEAASPFGIQKKSFGSPEGSPTSKFGGNRRSESFKIDFSRPQT